MTPWSAAKVARFVQRDESGELAISWDSNAARQCLALAEASRSSLLSKSVRSSASSRSRSVCGTSFTNAGLRVTESITAHKSPLGNFSIVYRIVELNLRNRMLASSVRGLLQSQERTFTGGVSTSVSCHTRLMHRCNDEAMSSFRQAGGLQSPGGYLIAEFWA
jgi:hypothetical protein